MAAKKAKGLPGLDLALKYALETERQRTVDAIRKASEFPLETAAQRDKLSALSAQAHERVKALEAERTSVTKPLNEVLRTINGWFKPTRDSLEAFQATAKQRIGARLAELRAEQDAALAQIESGAGRAPDEAFAIAHQAVEVPAGMSARTVYELRVDDLEQIPKAFLLPNVALIRAEFQAGRHVAGCSWVEQEQLVKARS